MPSTEPESGSTKRRIGSTSNVTHRPVPVGLPADTMPSLPRMALPWSCGENRHSFGSSSKTASAASIVPAARRRACDRNRRNGPQNFSSVSARR